MKFPLGSLRLITVLIYAYNEVNAALLLIFMLHFLFFSPVNHLPENTEAVIISHGTTSGIVQVLCPPP